VAPDLATTTHTSGVVISSMAGETVKIEGMAPEPRPPVSSET
jgi:hypothetical protein